MRYLLLSILLSALSMPAWSAEEVNLYSARKENLIKPLLDDFTKQTGIKVNLITGKADALLKRLQSEGKQSPADLFITVDAGRLHRAKAAGVLQTLNDKDINAAIPAHLRDPEGYWFGLSKRARVIFYAKDRVDPKNISSYADLAKPEWKGKICIRSSNNIYNQSLLASIIAHDGAEKAQAWANGVVANMARKPNGGDRDQIKAAAAGQCDLAVGNTYYYGKMLHGKDIAQQDAANKMGIIWPNQNTTGTHINVSGIGITQAAKNKANAIKLIKFLINDQSQAWYAKVNYEYPVKPGVAWSDQLKAWGQFKADDLNLSKLGENNAQAIRIFDKAGWR